MMCINQVLKRFKMSKMKIDTIQFILNRFTLSQKVWWYDSDIYDTIHIWIDSKKMWNDSDK